MIICKHCGHPIPFGRKKQYHSACANLLLQQKRDEKARLRGDYTRRGCTSTPTCCGVIMDTHGICFGCNVCERIVMR